MLTVSITTREQAVVDAVNVRNFRKEHNVELHCYVRYLDNNYVEAEWGTPDEYFSVEARVVPWDVYAGDTPQCGTDEQALVAAQEIVSRYKNSGVMPNAYTLMLVLEDLLNRAKG